MPPTIAGFINFVRLVMAINNTVLPDNSWVFQYVYDTAIATVNDALVCVPSPKTSDSIYAQAVYNCAADLLVNVAPDVPNAPAVQGSDPPLPYFANLRRKLNLDSFVGGVITGASDEGTSETMVVPDFVKDLTMMALQQLKTPWGRRYMAIAQQYGSLVGIT